MVEALLSRGIDADSQDCDGWTALSYATSTPSDHKKLGDKALVKQILESGNNPKAHDSHIKSSLAATTRRDYEGIVKLLLQYMANPDTVNVNWGGWKPLMVAAATGCGNTVRLLLDTGNVNPKRRDETGHDQIAVLLSSPIMETNVTINEAVCTTDQLENAPLIASRATGPQER
ncbi:ankyrin [Aspergillus eucalypticola CBS 122712]|uniref:Ankyrin n=1 Tax=Aspergillus eucalypticola (strain CBS 122712 / IBT 29274) TaxID=1448314 RepID=A0A317UPG0_ASPEC|nr:ankyrin [Aspergillus eucalypticola CBS 122712]PWY63591.1 ankyrin [Aspergillus eucalypticola CBS 122712]